MQPQRDENIFYILNLTHFFLENSWLNFLRKYLTFQTIQIKKKCIKQIKRFNVLNAGVQFQSIGKVLKKKQTLINLEYIVFQIKYNFLSNKNIAITCYP